MECYTDFSYLYDMFMEDVPYDEWTDFVDGLLSSYGNDVKSIIDLGCGTGNITERLFKKGYEVMGVDISADMLSVASEKALMNESDILFINQDMRELSVIDRVDAVVSLCDCINYLITDEDVLETFTHVKDSLKNGGIFIFDFNTTYKYETVIGDTTIAENRDECSFIWENYYSPADHINEYDVTFFTRIDEKNPDVFRRFSETHIQRGYDIEEMKKLAEYAGFKYVVSLDEETHKSPDEKAERVYMVLRK